MCVDVQSYVVELFALQAFISSPQLRLQLSVAGDVGVHLVVVAVVVAGGVGEAPTPRPSQATR